jgi:hypothetical protein
MGSTGRLRALEQMDRVADAQEVKEPVKVVLSQDEMEKVLVDCWLDGLSLEEAHHGEVD